MFAWQSFWRNFWLSVVTISIIVLTFISINSLVIINFITDAAIADVKDKVDVSLYFRPDVTEAQVLEVQTYLSALTQVKDIVYVSQDQALDAFRQQHREDSTIIQSLESLDSNPIGATLQIHAKTLEDYPSIVDVVNNSKYNDLILDKSFDDNQRYIVGIKETSDNINQIVLTVSMLFTLIAALIVFNTIRVAIYTHQQEIYIMKLVGATNWFIRAPFLFEAILYGILACLISVAGVYGLLNIIQPKIFKYGEQKRDHIYVKDAVAATIKAIDAKKSGIYNVGTGIATSFNELINALNEVLGASLEPEYFDMPFGPKTYQNNTQADTKNAEKFLGFKAKYRLKQGIEDYKEDIK